MIENFQMRVVEELTELHAKRVKLSDFIQTKTFSETVDKDEQTRLKQQHSIMLDYESVLRARIRAFKPVNG